MRNGERMRRGKNEKRKGWEAGARQGAHGKRGYDKWKGQQEENMIFKKMRIRMRKKAAVFGGLTVVSLSFL